MQIPLLSRRAAFAALSTLRGAQFTDSEGTVSFETIYPGWYAGRAAQIQRASDMGSHRSVPGVILARLHDVLIQF